MQTDPANAAPLSPSTLKGRFTPEKWAALAKLRARCRDRLGACKLYECGIYMGIRFRGEQDARSFATEVIALGGDVDEIAKSRKARFTGDLTWRVVFSIGIDEDIYLRGKATRAEIDAWRSPE